MKEIIVHGQRVLTIDQTATLYQVSRRTIFNWMLNGKVKWGTGPGGRRYVYYDSLALTPAAPEAK